MRRSPFETKMSLVVSWIFWLSCLANWQVSCSRYVVQLQQNIRRQSDCKHEWQSTFCPKRTWGSRSFWNCSHDTRSLSVVLGRVTLVTKWSNRPTLTLTSLHIPYHLLTHCCARLAEGRSDLHNERSWLVIWARPTDIPQSSSTCCSHVLIGRPSGRFQSATGGVPLSASVDSLMPARQVCS